ncbi:ATP-dependent helicase [Pseudotamlana agarivorans]|uniref:ATP-dependent helicase n=1 Tax=Pseudotamlana agarivorans TaxID=481183 RepID=UPI000829CA51|nr:ATP-dependent helicase [Tamlana agarivorans]
MISRLENKEVYNPIRDHININFEQVDSVDDALAFISNDLSRKGFDPEKSRVLIFVPTRKKTENIAELLSIKLNDTSAAYGNKIDFYHAGLDGIEREEKYDQFNAGDVVILVATKAFGMGMDIKNIHYIYHVGPASTFEDYLQEVGRAGRHKGMLEEAGFSTQNPIQTICLFLKDDFKKLKDKLHESQITWTNLNEVREIVFDYVKQFKTLEVDEEQPFALPLDLLEQSDEFNDKFNKDTFFRVSLFWLEKLERIKLGVYTPTQLPIQLMNDNSNSIEKVGEDKLKQQINSLLNGLNEYQKDNFPSSQFVMIEMNKLKAFVPDLSPGKLLGLLFRVQNLDLIRIERTITLEPTKTRIDELKEWEEMKWCHDTKSPILEALFELAHEILNSTSLGDQRSFDGAYLDHLRKEVTTNHFIPDNIFWKETKGKHEKEISKDEIAKILAEDFITKRSKFALKLISFLPKIRHKTVIQINPDTKHPEITQLVYNGYQKHDEWKALLNDFKDKLYVLIQNISKEFIIENKKRFNIVDLIVKLDIIEQEEDYLQKLVFIVKALAYLKGYGSLVPMGIELFIKDTTSFAEKDQSSNDYQVFNEFNESNQMRELRLLALECLSRINTEDYDTYIKDYFRGASVSDIIRLLEDKLGEEHENLKAFRIEALNKAKEELNEAQRKVYDTNVNQNLQVIAGPGSGKTHTLTLRVAKLIQEEKVNPDNILVLAYNRAVVVELKERLERLFRALGYGKLIKRLKVYTFHGFCKFCLKNELDNLDFDRWTTTFIRKARNEPGLVAQKLGNVKYVFVDEFQDITSERMELLSLIANPENTKVCVIGDPNQSIYGYERAAVGDTMNPKPFYDRFKEIYKPQELNLNINYRSYPEILRNAEQLLSLNKSKFILPPLVANKVPKNNETYCHIIKYAKGELSWLDWLNELIETKEDSGSNKYSQVALMFRTNDEVYKAFNTVKEKMKNVRIRIQGGKSSPYRSREFYYFLKSFERISGQFVESSLIKSFAKEKELCLARFPNWDNYLLNLFHCILIEFSRIKDEDATYGELIDFVEDIANRDDGQFGKIYDNNIRSIEGEKAEQEIVITTMHKVKGIEYDAVIIPPSFANLPPRLGRDNAYTEKQIEEDIEEERRLLYVAYTRAKYKLIVIKYDREHSLDKGEIYKFPDDTMNRLGVKIPEGIDKMNISWGAQDYQETRLKVFNHLRDSIKLGAPVRLIKKINGLYTFWEVVCNNRISGQITSRYYPNTNKTELNGFLVSSIERYTYVETLKYDEKHSTNYASRWCESSKSRGYIYLVDFAGFGK